MSDHEKRRLDLERDFPGLQQSEYLITSPRTDTYNCVTWAALAKVDELWWPMGRNEFTPLGQLYSWPCGVPRRSDLETFIRALGQSDLGSYAVCPTGDLEPGIEKIAIYALGRYVTHLARQLPDGWWTSKLGDDEDIQHRVEALEGDTYDKVRAFLKRTR